jgi:hypothetical protein
MSLIVDPYMFQPIRVILRGYIISSLAEIVIKCDSLSAWIKMLIYTFKTCVSLLFLRVACWVDASWCVTGYIAYYDAYGGSKRHTGKSSKTFQTESKNCHKTEEKP